MNMYNAIQLKQIQVNQETRNYMLTKFLSSYDGWETNPHNQFIGISQAFHDYINYLGAELQISPRAFYYLDEVFGERKINDIDSLHGAMELLYATMMGARVGMFELVDDVRFTTAHRYLGTTSTEYHRISIVTLNICKYLYENTYTKLYNDLSEYNKRMASPYSLRMLLPYFAELIHFKYTDLATVVRVVDRLEKIGSVVHTDMMLVATILLITKNEPYLEMGFTETELVNVCEGIFVTEPKLKAHWNELILCKFFNYPSIHLKLVKWLNSEEVEEPVGI